MVPFLLLLLVLSAHAKQVYDVVGLWPGVAPDETDIIGPEWEDHDKQDPSKVLLKNVTTPRFDVYLPDKQVHNTAALILPGGSYKFLSVTLEGSEIAAWLNSLGVAAFVLKYRVPSRSGHPTYWVALEDAQRAAGLIRASSAKYQLDEGFKLGFIGFSAGAHCTAVAAAHVQRVYQPVDSADTLQPTPDWTMVIYPGMIIADLWNATTTPAAEVIPPPGHGLPHTFVVQTEDDLCHVNNALTYFSLARQHLSRAELHVYPRGGHGYGLRCKEEVCTWPERAAKWLHNEGLLP